MSGTGHLPQEKHQRHSQRKQTMFTKKQLANLEFLFSKNPYPAARLQKEMASKLEIQPTVLQVWFKNHRTKLKKCTQTTPYIPSNSAYALIEGSPDHSVGHNIVHFVCCQDLNIYSLCPIMESQILSQASLLIQRHRTVILYYIHHKKQSCDRMKV
ncbi:divergent paired-related homeobox-like [Meles meles]|uniref:divergent paired-related homeobox-like n=1 Tax=Meles meles TaxID=9662 RepID=UPI001E69A07B|nr:divergent paired-related homeobox-like [Meles meles]